MPHAPSAADQELPEATAGLESRQIWQVFRKRGLRGAAPYVLGIILFGVIDQFTAGIIPLVGRTVGNFFSPPVLTIGLSNRVEALRPEGIKVARTAPPPWEPVEVRLLTELTMEVPGGGRSYLVELRRTTAAGDVEVLSEHVEIEPGDDYRMVTTGPSAVWEVTRRVPEPNI